MKVAMIHGQNHEGSSCRLGRMLAEKMEEAEVREFFLPRDLEHFCLGCQRCIRDEGSCPFYAEKSAITDAIEDADILILTTPTYCMRASAPMKSFLDMTFTYWMPHRPRGCMFSKRAVVISTAAGSGARKATGDVVNALRYWGVPKVTRYCVTLRAESIDSLPDARRSGMDRDLSRIARSLSSDRRVKVGLRTKMLFAIMRSMHGKGLSSSPEEHEYWESNGWLDSERPWRTRAR